MPIPPTGFHGYQDFSMRRGMGTVNVPFVSGSLCSFVLSPKKVIVVQNTVAATVVSITSSRSRRIFDRAIWWYLMGGIRESGITQTTQSSDCFRNQFTVHLIRRKVDECSTGSRFPMSDKSSPSSERRKWTSLCNGWRKAQWLCLLLNRGLFKLKD